MPSVLERLRTALAPEIFVERELASGGMGIVFVGRDTVLDRPVAIKTLKPELANAVAVERFRREAQAAAGMSHPNVVRVYKSGLADGLPYFTMELVEGETLRDRLSRGTLSAGETIALGSDLLGALAAAHTRGLIHRDVKPSNIFLADGRHLLGDFGIVSAVDSQTTELTTAGNLVGTPKYMAPEQRTGSPVQPATDLFAVGLVLFEACTGRDWTQVDQPSRGDWTGVPASLRDPLERALEPTLAKRWRDAASFGLALERARHASSGVALGSTIDSAVRSAKTMRPARRPWLLFALALALAAAYALYHAPRAPPPPIDVAVYPFEVGGLGSASVGDEITGLTRWYFDRLPTVKVQASKLSNLDWNASTLPLADRLAALTTRRHARFGIWGVVRRREGRLEVEASVVDRHGAPRLHVVVQADSSDHLALADSLGARLLAALSSDLGPIFRRTPQLARVAPDAVVEFLEGEQAVSHDAWLSAEQHFARALAIDSTFVLAAWRLGNVRRWMPLRPTPPFPAGFRRLFEAHRNDLSVTDQRLVEAQFAPSGEARFQRYEAARQADPGDATAMLLYGDELFHRGPLAGHALEEAVAMLRDATVADPTLAPAWEHLAWALIRLGWRDEAAVALDSLRAMAGRAEESEIYLPDFLRVAFAARFTPEALSAGTPLLEAPAALALAARGALAFDVPEVELVFGRRLGARENPPPLRASGHVAQGVALLALGRPAAALAQFDSAAGLLPDPDEGRLQAAEWRVLPAALGVPGMPAAEAAPGRRILARIADSAGSFRAAWALSLDAFARGDTAEGRLWRARVARESSPEEPLGLLLAAMETALTGDPTAALRISTPALAYDSAGYAPDPFYRSALHLLRGQWMASAGRTIDADRSWLWYENTDVVGWPSAEAQPAEVDWALGSYARLRRAELAAAERRYAAACPLADGALRAWARPESTMAAAVTRLRQVSAGCGT